MSDSGNLIQLRLDQLCGAGKSSEAEEKLPCPPAKKTTKKNKVSGEEEKLSCPPAKKIKKSEALKEKKNNSKGEASTSSAPKKKQKTNDGKAIGKSEGAKQKPQKPEKPKTNCLKSCKPGKTGKKTGCAFRSYKRATHGKTKSCHEIDRLIKAMGMAPKEAVSKCTKAAIMKGLIDVKGEAEELEKVIYEKEGECGHVIKAKLGDLLRQPDYAGLDYEDGCQNATVVCTERDASGEECEEGRTYVTGICQGNISFDCGKFHNHCGSCPGMGTCIGDYRMAHRFGKHQFVGSGGWLVGGGFW